MIAPERPRGRHVDENADQRERVRVNPQRDARGDDRPHGKHADRSHEPGKGHLLL
jgi:hypothetical protein